MSKVPAIPPPLLSVANPIRAGRRVRGPRQQQDMARTNNWLHGTGSSLIVSGPRFKLIDPGDSYSASFYIHPHEQNPNRLWCLTVVATNGNATGTFETPTGTEIGKWFAPAAGPITRSFRFVETVASPSAVSTGVNVVVKNDATSAGPILVFGIGCYELPRSNISTYGGSDIPAENTLARAQPIFESSAHVASIDAVVRAAAKAPLQARRCGLFNWSHDDGVVISETTDPGGEETDPLEDGGESNIFEGDIPIQTRLLWQSTTAARPIEYAIDVRVSGGTGHIRLRSSVLDTVDIPVTNTTRAWKTGTILVKTEDPSRRSIDGGLRGGTLSAIRVTAWAAGGQTITPFGVNFGESEDSSAGP